MIIAVWIAGVIASCLAAFGLLTFSQAQGKGLLAPLFRLSSAACLVASAVGTIALGGLILARLTE